MNPITINIQTGNLMNENLFYESQKFRQLLVWGALVPIDIFFIYVIISQLVLGIPVGSKPMADWGVVLVSLMVLLVNGLFLVMKLETIIREDGIYYKFFPFHLTFKKIAWMDTRELYLRRYNPLREYGGWGIKIGPAGKVYNVSGNQGVQLILTNGANILFGTQKSEELKEVLDQMSLLPKND